MSPSNVAVEVFGTALRDMATFAIWMILVAAVVAAIVTGLLALRRPPVRLVCATKPQTARPMREPRAHQAHAERPDSRTHPSACPTPALRSDRGESAPDKSRVPVPSAH